MRILIVDDEEAVASALASAVVLHGHEPSIATRGAEAIARAEAELPDAVLLDLVLPDLSGIEVLRRIRVTRPTLPVIVLTGHAKPSELAEAWRLGATDVLEKPCLLNRITDALRCSAG